MMWTPRLRGRRRAGTAGQPAPTPDGTPGEGASSPAVPANARQRDERGRFVASVRPRKTPVE
jgi:hypothetical protein